MKKSPGRLLPTSISQSKSLPKLSPDALNLFFMIISHLNSYGKLLGEPHFIKGQIVPLFDRFNVCNIEEYLKEIHKHTNIKWYQIKGLYYLQSTKFDEFQNLRRRGTDYLPDYPRLKKDNSRINPGQLQELSIPETETETEVQIEEQHHHKVTHPVEENPNVVSDADVFKSLLSEKLDEAGAKSIINKFPRVHILLKIQHYNFLKKHQPHLVSKNGPGFLRDSIEKYYNPPEGFEEYQNQLQRQETNGKLKELWENLPDEKKQDVNKQVITIIDNRGDWLTEKYKMDERPDIEEFIDTDPAVFNEVIEIRNHVLEELI